MPYVIVAGLAIMLLVVGPVFSQERTSCDDRLVAAQKELIILKSSREQTEASMAAVWARLERSEDDLKKAKAVQPEPKKE